MNAAVDGDRRLAPILTVVAATTMGAFAGSFAGGPVLVAAFGLAWGLALAGQPFSAQQLDQLRVWVALSWVRARWMG